MIAEIIGWSYTIITMAGSINITTRGESKGAWAIYVTSATIGMIYFAILGNISQFALVSFFLLLELGCYRSLAR